MAALNRVLNLLSKLCDDGFSHVTLKKHGTPCTFQNEQLYQTTGFSPRESLQENGSDGAKPDVRIYWKWSTQWGSIVHELLSYWSKASLRPMTKDRLTMALDTNDNEGWAEREKIIYERYVSQAQAGELINRIILCDGAASSNKGKNIKMKFQNGDVKSVESLIKDRKDWWYFAVFAHYMHLVVSLEYSGQLLEKVEKVKTTKTIKDQKKRNRDQKQQRSSSSTSTTTVRPIRPRVHLRVRPRAINKENLSTSTNIRVSRASLVSRMFEKQQEQRHREPPFFFDVNPLERNYTLFSGLSRVCYLNSTLSSVKQNLKLLTVVRRDWMRYLNETCKDLRIEIQREKKHVEHDARCRFSLKELHFISRNYHQNRTSSSSSSCLYFDTFSLSDPVDHKEVSNLLTALTPEWNRYSTRYIWRSFTCSNKKHLARRGGGVCTEAHMSDEFNNHKVITRRKFLDRTLNKRKGFLVCLSTDENIPGPDLDLVVVPDPTLDSDLSDLNDVEENLDDLVDKEKVSHLMKFWSQQQHQEEEEQKGKKLVAFLVARPRKSDDDDDNHQQGRRRRLVFELSKPFYDETGAWLLGMDSSEILSCLYTRMEELLVQECNKYKKDYHQTLEIRMSTPNEFQPWLQSQEFIESVESNNNNRIMMVKIIQE